MTENGVILVQALYSFSGSNNDELCFKKGDIFVVTQREEGGWWEGTFNENTGWFPSNYVKEYKSTEGGSLTKPEESPPLSPQQSQQQIVYRSMVSRDILESERNHVTELQNISTKYLNPLLNSNILSDNEYKQLVGNIDNVISVHSMLLNLLEEQFTFPCKEQKIGGTFLKIAPNLQNVHKVYITNHPKAVCIIEKYKDELNSFMEFQGAARPGTLVLTTALSQPFRRLEKYPGVLQEFQRHIEDAHPDRGDTQRSTHVYRELAAYCGSIRRQKQLELEVLTNKIHGFDGGDTLSVLGDVLHMRSVALLPDNRDRYLVLFPGCLVVLSLSSRASSFIFEGKYQLSLLSVRELEDGSLYKNAFEVSGPHMEPIIAICQTTGDQVQWVEILRQNIQSSCTSSPVPYKTPLSRSPPPPPAHGSPLLLSHINASPSFKSNGKVIKPWTMSCLRPSPPLRPGFMIRGDKRKINNRKKEENWHEDDALILRVIEFYCTSAKTRYTINSSCLENNTVMNASQEKIIVEEKRGNKVILEEKSLIDTVYALKDQLINLTQNYQHLRTDFENERKETQSLRKLIGQHLSQCAIDGSEVI